MKGNVVCVPVGNVTADTEFSFEYGVKKLKSKTQKPSQDPEGLSQLLKIMSNSRSSNKYIASM